MSELEDALNRVLSSPEDMAKIMQLAQSLGVEAPRDAPVTQSGESCPEPELSSMLGHMVQSLSSGESSGCTALMAALKPYLREDRQAKVERAIKLARIAKIAGNALNEMGGVGLGL